MNTENWKIGNKTINIGKNGQIKLKIHFIFD